MPCQSSLCIVGRTLLTAFSNFQFDNALSLTAEVDVHQATRVARAAIGIQAQNCAPGSAATVDLPALEVTTLFFSHCVLAKDLVWS